MKTFILIFTAILLVSCENEPVSTHNTDNPNIKAEYLFSIDSCKIYRFEDSRTHYICICPNNQSVTDTYTVHHGKSSTTYEDEIQTVYKSIK